MKKCTKVLSILTVISILFSSCGVMFGGSQYKGTIIAKDHPNAQIYVNGNKAGQGKVQGLYPRNAPLRVELKQEGCEPKEETFYNTFRTGNFILSLFCWGIIGVGIDLGTGASYKPDHINNPSVFRETDKKFTFMVDYSGCPTK